MTDWLHKKVLKYPAGGTYTNNIYFKDPRAGWYLAIGSTYLNNIYDSIENSSNVADTIGGINNMQTRHHGLYTTHGDPASGRPITNDPNVQQYQQDIIDKYGYVNTTGIQGGINNGRYKTDSNKTLTNDKPDANGIWGTDQSYGGQTDDRRLLGREGDYTDDEINTINNRLGQSNVEMYLDPTTKYYMLRLKLPIDEIPPGEEPTEDKSYNPAYFKKLDQKQGIPWSDWLGIGLRLGYKLGSSNNMYNTATKLTAPLKEAPWIQRKVTDAYYTNSQLNLNAEAIRLQYADLASHTSDIDQASSLMRKGTEQANSSIFLGAVLKQQDYNLTQQQVQAAADTNMLSGVNVRNDNTTSLTALRLAILNERQKMYARDLAALGEASYALDKSWGDVVKTARINRDSKLRAQNTLEALSKIAEINKKLLDLYYNPQTSDVYKQFVNDLLSTLNTDAEGKEIMDEVSWNRLKNELINKKTYSAESQDILNKLWNSAYASKYKTLFENEYQNKYRLALQEMDLIHAALAAKNQMIDTLITNQSFFPWLRHYTPTVIKNGGTIKAERGAKLLSNMKAYILDNRRASNKSSDVAVKSLAKAYENLNKELDRLNQQQLALLKIMYK